jgi:hypothetical protein
VASEKKNFKIKRGDDDSETNGTAKEKKRFERNSIAGMKSRITFGSTPFGGKSF